MNYAAGTLVGLVVGLILCEWPITNPSITEIRAKKAALQYVYKNEIVASNLSCIGDIDRNGYGYCNLITIDNKKISLQCSVNYASQTNECNAINPNWR